MTNRACPDGLDPAAAVLAVVASIPCGRVATYGQVAVLAGLGRAARFVGHTLARLEEDGYPWPPRGQLRRPYRARLARADGAAGGGGRRLQARTAAWIWRAFCGTA